MRASASAGARGNFPIGADRREGRSHLHLRLSRRRRRDARRVSARASSPRRSKAAKQPLIIVGAGRVRAHGRRGAVLALAAKAARRVRRRRRTAGTASRVLHTAASRVGGARSRLRAGRRAARRAARDGAGRRARRAVPARRRRDRRRARRRSSSTSARMATAARTAPTSSCRAPPIPEKSGDLRQHRRPGAAGQPRRVPAGRCAGGLGDPARAVRRARPQAALRLAGAAARRRCSPRIRISMRLDQIAPAMPADIAKLAQARRHARQGAARARASPTSI